MIVYLVAKPELGLGWDAGWQVFHIVPDDLETWPTNCMIDRTYHDKVVAETRAEELNKAKIGYHNYP